jgi:hypothetical protein
MGTWGRTIKEIQEGIVRNIDEKLTSSTLWLTSISHAEGTDVVGDFSSELVWDSSTRSTGVGLAIARLEGCFRVRATGTGATTVGVLGVRALFLVVMVMVMGLDEGRGECAVLLIRVVMR